MEELGQLFHDFNFLVQPIALGQAVDLDQSDVAIGLTNTLGECPAIKKHCGMERRAANLGKKSTAPVAKQVLLRFVKVACEGVDTWAQRQRVCGRREAGSSQAPSDQTDRQRSETVGDRHQISGKS